MSPLDSEAVEGFLCGYKTCIVCEKQFVYGWEVIPYGDKLCDGCFRYGNYHRIHQTHGYRKRGYGFKAIP